MIIMICFSWKSHPPQQQPQTQHQVAHRSKRHNGLWLYFGGQDGSKGVLTPNHIIHYVQTIGLDVGECHPELSWWEYHPSTALGLQTLPILTIEHLLLRWRLIQPDIHKSIITIDVDPLVLNQQEIYRTNTTGQAHILKNYLVVTVDRLIIGYS